MGSHGCKEVRTYTPWGQRGRPDVDIVPGVPKRWIFFEVVDYQYMREMGGNSRKEQSLQLSVSTRQIEAEAMCGGNFFVNSERFTHMVSNLRHITET